MYDRLGALLRRALDEGELPKADSSSAYRKGRQYYEYYTHKARAESVKEDSSPVAPLDVAKAISALGLSVNASYEECRKVYKERLLALHPDTSGGEGDLAKMQELLALWALIREWFRSVGGAGGAV